jgi:phosphoribosylanthranilate isomerase
VRTRAKICGIRSTEDLAIAVAAGADVVSHAAGRRVVKAVHVTGAEVVKAALAAATYCDAVLLDSRTLDRLGGTGRPRDWSISTQVVKALAKTGRPVILAGGLTPSSLREAITTVSPYAVDVNSGVEDDEGSKTADACTTFVSLAHGTS